MFFFETGTLSDTRTNQAFRDMCPHCLSTYTINVELLLRPSINMDKSGLYLTGKNKHRYLFKVKMQNEWVEYLKYLRDHGVVFKEKKTYRSSD